MANCVAVHISTTRFGHRRETGGGTTVLGTRKNYIRGPLTLTATCHYTEVGFFTSQDAPFSLYNLSIDMVQPQAGVLPPEWQSIAQWAGDIALQPGYDPTRPQSRMETYVIKRLLEQLPTNSVVENVEEQVRRCMAIAKAVKADPAKLESRLRGLERARDDNQNPARLNSIFAII